MTDLLPVLKAVVLLGRSYSRRGGLLVTSCPGCEGELVVVGRSAVCRAPGCQFGRGGAIDLMAYQLGSYRQAIELAAESVPAYRDRVDELALEFLAKRRLTAFALEAERLNAEPQHDRLMLRSRFVQHLGVQADGFNRGFWFLTGEQVRRLNRLLLDMGATPPPSLHDRPAAVAPYWGDHHSICMLAVLPFNMSTCHSCPVEAFRSSWFGLQQMEPSNDSVLVYPSFHQAMARAKTLSVVRDDVFPTSLQLNLKCGNPGLEFGRLTFKSPDDRWLDSLANWSHAEGFDTAGFESPALGRVDLRQLLDHLLKTCSGEFHRFLDLVSGMKVSPEIRAHLLAQANGLADARLGRLLTNTISRRLLEIDDQGSVYECADGYHAESKGQLRQTTNFTLEFQAVTCFSALADVLYSGRFYVGTASYPFEIPARRFDSTNQLVETLQSIQTLSGGADPSLPTATVYRPRDFRRVIDVFRVQNASLTRLRGVSSLGWTRRHDAFILPIAVVDQNGIHGGVRYHPEEEGEHHCYSSGGAPPDGLPADLPEFDPYLAEFLAALVSQMVRFHHGLKVRLWPLLNNAQTREKAGRIFAGIGQTAPFRLTKIIPRNLELNRGLPCLVAPLNDLQMNKLQLAGAVFADQGLDLGRLPDDQIDRASCVLPALLAEVSRRIICQEEVSFTEQRSVHPLGRMAAEGATLIQRDFWSGWPDAGMRCSAIDISVAASADTLASVMLVEDRTDTVLIAPAFWLTAGCQPEDLHLDLGLCCKTVVMTDQGLRVDRNSMYRLLGEYFGEVPVLLPA